MARLQCGVSDKTDEITQLMKELSPYLQKGCSEAKNSKRRKNCINLTTKDKKILKVDVCYDNNDYTLNNLEFN